MVRNYAFAIAAIGGFAIFPAPSQTITRQVWGATDAGESIELFHLKGAKGMEATISNYGGRLVSLLVPNKNGSKTDVQLGYDDFNPYKTNGSYGAIIGRYMGRISKGGSFPLAGSTVQLQKTTPDAKFVLHGGTAPFARKVFNAEIHSGVEPSLILTTTSPDGDGGFPGALQTTVTYTLTRDNGLKIDYQATSDRPTIANLTTHAYFALQGEGAGDVGKQILQVFADKYTPADADDLVNGEIASVAETPVDLRKPVSVASVLASQDPQITMRKGIEINWVINGKPGSLRPAARLYDPTTGIQLDTLTTQPCLLIWSANTGDRTTTGKAGHVYRNNYALTMETSAYLDAPNHPSWPQPTVTPAKPYHETTLYRFTTK